MVSATTDTTQAISTPVRWTRTVELVATAGMSALLGALVTLAFKIPNPEPGSSLRGIALACVVLLGMIAFIHALTRRGAGATVGALKSELVGNRNAALAVQQGQDQLLAIVDAQVAAITDLSRHMGAMTKELGRLREQLDGALRDVRRRMSESTADVIAAYEAGIAEGERRGRP